MNLCALLFETLLKQNESDISNNSDTLNDCVLTEQFVYNERVNEDKNNLNCLDCFSLSKCKNNKSEFMSSQMSEPYRTVEFLI